MWPRPGCQKLRMHNSHPAVDYIVVTYLRTSALYLHCGSTHPGRVRAGLDCADYYSFSNRQPNRCLHLNGWLCVSAVMLNLGVNLRTRISGP